MAENDLLESFVEPLRVSLDDVTSPPLGNDLDGLPKLEDMGPIGLAPTRRGNHGSPRELGENGQTFEGVGLVPEKLGEDSVFLDRKLIENRNHDLIPFQQVEDIVE